MGCTTRSYGLIAMITAKDLTVEVLVSALEKDMELTVLSGAAGLRNHIHTAEMNRPGLAFAGFYDVFAHDRIQVLGNTEMSYLRNLKPEERAQRLDNTLNFRMPCLIVTNGNQFPEDSLHIADRYSIPIIMSTVPTTRLISQLNTYLEQYFAPTVNVHAVLLDVYGMGTLLLGGSGVGKSECALELIERGHRLVSDDYVILRRISKDLILGRSPDFIKHHMEIRGLGILNIEMLFGVSSVLTEKYVDLVVQLERWNESANYERLGIDDRTHSFFDVEVPMYVVPVQPGRNISIMVEMAALTQRLKKSDINPAKMLEERLLKYMTVDTSFNNPGDDNPTGK